MICHNFEWRSVVIGLSGWDSVNNCTFYFVHIKNNVTGNFPFGKSLKFLVKFKFTDFNLSSF